MNAQTVIEPPSLAKLREPFPPNQISKLPKETRKQIDERKTNRNCVVWKCEECGGAHHKNAVHLDYVGHAALTDRLLDTDPHWTWEPVSFTQDGLPAFDQNKGLWIKLTVLGVTRLGYGSADDKTGGDAVKEIIGDALRNAAMRFGAALDLWHKGDLHGDDDAEPEAKTEAKSDGPPRDDRIDEKQLAKLQMLIKATKTTEIAFLRKMGAPKDAGIFQLPQSLFSEAVEFLENKLAEMAKAETDKDARRSDGWSNTRQPTDEITDADIPY